MADDRDRPKQYKCVICMQVFNAGEAQNRPCAPGQSHMVQELIHGARAWEYVNGQPVETHGNTDFIPTDSSDLKKWGDLAKKLGYETDD